MGVIYMWRNHDPHCFEPIFAGLERARERAERELGLSLYWIFDAVRHFTVEEAGVVFRKAIEMRRDYPVHRRRRAGRGRTPLRLGAVSADFMPRRATPACGSPTTPGRPPAPRPSGKRCAIGSERIGHALSAIQDAGLMDELKARKIPLELNPTSNVRTGVCPIVCRAPVAALLRCRAAGHRQFR